jgi:hypothetical protein
VICAHAPSASTVFISDYNKRSEALSSTKCSISVWQNKYGTVCPNSLVRSLVSYSFNLLEQFSDRIVLSISTKRFMHNCTDPISIGNTFSVAIVRSRSTFANARLAGRKRGRTCWHAYAYEAS